MKSNFKMNPPPQTKADIITPGFSPPREYAWQVASNLFVSFRYAWAGISYAFLTQRNFRIHIFITMMAISLGL
jgi:diacylglycerol kinase (ATP)